MMFGWFEVLCCAIADAPPTTRRPHAQTARQNVFVIKSLRFTNHWLVQAHCPDPIRARNEEGLTALRFTVVRMSTTRRASRASDTPSQHVVTPS
jgi:hypothetical protein